MGVIGKAKEAKLIMLEGMSGTGKSTNSYFLYVQHELNGKSVKWVHEVARPHPVLFFDEVSLTYGEYEAFLKTYPESKEILNQIAVFRKSTVGVDLLEVEWEYKDVIGETAFKVLQDYHVWTYPLDKYKELALEKWAYFAEKAIENKTEIYIMDSCIFQFQIFSFLLKNAPYEELKRFIEDLTAIIKPLNPSLIYLYRESFEDAINYLVKERGTEFLEYIWERDKAQPYYRDKPKGAEGFKEFQRDYNDIANKLFDMAACRKIDIEVTQQNWISYENEMLSFLDLKRKSSPDALPESGIYRNEILDMEIKIDGLTMKDPEGAERTLTAKSDCEFYAERLPVILYFDKPNQITIAGEQILARWTTTGTQFTKV